MIETVISYNFSGSLILSLSLWISLREVYGIFPHIFIVDSNFVIVPFCHAKKQLVC